MEIVDEHAGILTNFEVLQVLKDVQASRNGYRKPNKNQQHATILYSSLKYLHNTPCTHQQPEVIKEFNEAVNGFNLTKAERLQLLNQRPTTAVEIQLIVEESEERLSEQQIEELLNIVTTILPDPAQQEEQHKA